MNYSEIGCSIVDWIHVAQERATWLVTIDWLLWTRLWTFSCHKWRKIHCVAKRLLPSNVHTYLKQLFILLVRCLSNRCRLFF